MLVPIIDVLRTQGIEYKGVLYAGLSDRGWTQGARIQLPLRRPQTERPTWRLKTDLLDDIDAVIDGQADMITPGVGPATGGVRGHGRGAIRANTK